MRGVIVSPTPPVWLEDLFNLRSKEATAVAANPLGSPSPTSHPSQDHRIEEANTIKTIRKMNTVTKTSLYLPMTALLLTAVLVAPAAADHAVPFKGTIRGNESVDISPPSFSIDGSGGENSTHLGAFTCKWDFAGLLGESAAGPRRFVAANGDVITTEGSAAGTPPDANGDQFVTEEHTITGGTGRFAGASGSFRLERDVNFFSGVTSGSFSGTINLRSH